MHAKQLFIFDLVLLSFAILMLGAGVFFFTWKPGPGTNVQINISFGSERIMSGNEVHMTVEYVNNSKEELRDAVLAVRLPRGFIIDENKTKKIDLNNKTFNVGTLPSGSGGVVDIYGTLWTNVNEMEKVIATLSFKPEERPNKDQAAGIYLLKLSDSVLNANLDIPNKTYSRQKLTYTINLKNNGVEKLNDLRVIVNGTERKKLELGATEATSTSETVLTPAKGGKYFMTAEVRVLINGNSYTQKSMRGEIELISPRVVLSAAIKDAPNYTEPGATLPLEVMWKNEGQLKLNNQRIIIQPTPGVVDLPATALLNHIKKDGNALVIDAKSRTALSDGKPESGETFILNIVLMPNFDKKLVGVNKLTVKPIFEASTEGLDNQIFSFEGAGTSIPLSAEVFLRTEARYYTDEGDQLGRGPLAPQVGKTTKYWIFATLFDKVNPVAASKLVFNLAPGVTFTGKQSVTIGPELIYNQTDRTVTWNYAGVIPADSESGFYFEVAVTPTREQAGYILNLVTEASYHGVDDEVGKVFNIKTKNTSNILPDGDMGKSKGAVVVQ
jgi:hypothetical protein